MNSSTDNNKQKRIGKAVFKVILEKAIESIPIYGVVFVTGYKIYDAIQQELGKDKERELTKTEILQAVRALTQVEAQEAVDQALNSPKGSQTLKNLNPTELAQARKQLLQLPSEFDQILADIETGERKKEEETITNDQRGKENAYINLQHDLKQHLEHEQLSSAYLTVQKMLVRKPNDQEAKRVWKFLYNRRAYISVRGIGVGGFFRIWSLLVVYTLVIPTLLGIVINYEYSWSIIIAEALVALLITTAWKRFFLITRRKLKQFYSVTMNGAYIAVILLLFIDLNKIYVSTYALFIFMFISILFVAADTA